MNAYPFASTWRGFYERFGSLLLGDEEGALSDLRRGRVCHRARAAALVTELAHCDFDPVRTPEFQAVEQMLRAPA